MQADRIRSQDFRSSLIHCYIVIKYCNKTTIVDFSALIEVFDVDIALFDGIPQCVEANPSLLEHRPYLVQFLDIILVRWIAVFTYRHVYRHFQVGGTQSTYGNGKGQNRVFIEPGNLLMDQLAVRQADALPYFT